MSADDPRYEAARAADQEALAREREALLALMASSPTTLDGLAAVLEHVSEPEFLIR
jgi:hypothetical protein